MILHFIKSTHAPQGNGTQHQYTKIDFKKHVPLSVRESAAYYELQNDENHVYKVKNRLY